MRLPDFLLIGAMKAGSTTLANELSQMPEVFIPTVKEPHFLCNDSVLTPAGKANYARLFRRSRETQLCGEGSTGYSKLPTIKGVPRRARQLLGENLRVIYIVRDPVERAISHHYHLVRGGRTPADADRALREIPLLVQYGQYMTQLRPWIEEFGRERVHVVVFEEYLASRVDELSKLRSFLGLGACSDNNPAGSVKNRGEETRTVAPLFGKLVKRISRSQFYKVWIHPNLPRMLGAAAKLMVYRPAPPRPARPSAESLAYLRAQLAPDAQELADFLSRPEPLWPLDRDQTALASTKA